MRRSFKIILVVIPVEQLFQAAACFPCFETASGGEAEQFGVNLPIVLTTGCFLFAFQERKEDGAIFLFVDTFQRFRADTGRNAFPLHLVVDLDTSPFVEAQFVVYEIACKTAFVDETFF